MKIIKSRAEKRRQLGDGVVQSTLYIEDSGNATLSVYDCDHNEIKAAAVTKISILFHPIYIFSVTSISMNVCIFTILISFSIRNL